ncbi:MAG: amidohydrolase family protein [Gemmatimonadota bacterium]
MASTRRVFLATSGATLASLSAWPSLRPRRVVHDLVIRGGMLYDGLGGPGVLRDVAISKGRVVEIAQRISDGGREEIRAADRVVAPGFIDIHSHGDGTLEQDPRAESVIRQGITTIVVGQDGDSRAVGIDDRSFASMFAAIDRGAPSVNVAAMIGLGSVRGRVIGANDRPATGVELATMTAMVERALQEGACGASSGLEYTPGAFASLDELIALCRPLASRRLPYATHMRNEDDRLVAAVDEAIAVAQGAGCPLQISHLKTQGPRNWGNLDVVFARIASARHRGLDIAFDRYPYLAYQTGLTNLFPVWSRDGGTDAFLARLADSVTASRVRQEALDKVALIGGWDNVLVTGVRAAEDSAVVGQRLGGVAASRGIDPYDLAIGLLRRSRGNVGMVGFAMSETNLERILAHPLGMVCSDGGAVALDGPARRGSPHPRSLGTFPRVLGRYVRERKVLTLEQAIHKMTAQPADRVQLRDRGRLVVGAAADVVVFDPATVADRASYEAPFQYPVGIDTVIVNGAITLAGGERRGSGRGTSLRPRVARR